MSSKVRGSLQRRTGSLDRRRRIAPIVLVDLVVAERLGEPATELLKRLLGAGPEGGLKFGQHPVAAGAGSPSDSQIAR
ncbi:MAG: hypothetical protein QM286_03720 [Acidobacteriota bacterium]|nr:hypothetical protein [Acidobacteriota bacterium]